MALEYKIEQMRSFLLKENKPTVPSVLSGVTKEKIEAILRKIDRANDDQRDVIFALLDDTLPSWFSGAAPTTMFFHGASTAHIACHVGILQRGQRKLDREGRDYWLKPMWEIGAIEKVYFEPSTGAFIPGHPVSKSSNCAYCLSDSFRTILQAPDDVWPNLLNAWIQDDAMRRRLDLQAKLAEDAIKLVDRKHSDLIKACCEYYVPRYLEGYEVLYIDEGDGERVTEEQKHRLAEAGIQIELGDSMPDVLLWNKTTDSLWVIEAVTSDGEADIHKVRSLTNLARRYGKKSIGFTTAYQTWKAAANRQSKMKNLADKSCLWIQDDPAKQLFVQDMPSGQPNISG